MRLLPSGHSWAGNAFQATCSHNPCRRKWYLFARGLWLKSVTCISSFSVVLLPAPFASHQKWESHRNHLGITWDLRPSWFPCIGGKLLGDVSLPMQGDLEGLFLFHVTTCAAPRTRKITNVGWKPVRVSIFRVQSYENKNCQFRFKGR